MVKIIDQLLPDVFYNRLLKILDDNDKEFNWFWNTRTAESVNGEPLDENEAYLLETTLDNAPQKRL